MDKKQEEDNQLFNKKLSELTKISQTTQLDYFFDENYCDIKDPISNQWKTGLIIERDDDDVQIKFLNSNTNKNIYKFNVTNSNDKEIALFRKFTSEESENFNYNFIKVKENSITNTLIFEAKAMIKVLSELKDYSNQTLNDNFSSPLEMIQDIRGKIYYTFLNIINNNFQFEYEMMEKAKEKNKNKKKNNNEEEEEEDFNFESDINIEDVGNLLNDFLNFSVKFLEWINSHSYIGKLLTFNYNFILYDKECAFFSSLCEITSILSQLFKENKFFQTYKEPISQILKEWGLEKVDYKISTTLYNITKNKGIDKIMTEILTNNTQSFFVFEQLSKILSASGLILLENRLNIYDYYSNRIKNLTINEQKFISFNDIQYYCDKIRRLIDSVVIDDKDEKNVDSIHLQFLYNLISSNNLPLKIKGISLLSKMINENLIDNNRLVKFIQTVHLISAIILGSNIHEEILKRSYHIFSFVLKDPKINNTRMISTLFKELTNKNNSIADEIKDILMKISLFYNEKIQNYLFDEILNKININDFTKDLIDIIETSTINTKNEKGVNLLWRIINENEKSEIVDQSINSLSIVFKNKIFDKNLVEKYLIASEDKIENEDNVQCMKVFKTIIQIYGEELKNEIQEMDSKKNLMDILIKNCEVYIKSKDETKQLSLYSQSINIEIRLQIIFFIYDILHKKNKEEFKTTLTSLWKIFVLNENSKDLDKNIISRFIFNHFNYFEESQNLMEYVFNNIIINEEMNPPEIINYNIFALFNKFFDNVNSLKNKFTFVGNYKRIKNVDDLEGFEFFWKILKVTKWEKVKRGISTYLINLCLNPVNLKNKDDCVSMWKIFYNRIYNLIKKNNGNENITINNIVYFLQKFITFVDNDNKQICVIDEKKEKYPFTVNFILSSQNISKKIPVNLETDLIINLKEKASYYFKIPFKLIEIKIRNELISFQYEDDDKLFSSFINSKNSNSLEIEVNEIPNKIYTLENNPKKMILENENIFNELFYLLSSYNKYNKNSDLDYNSINNLIYYYPVGKQLLNQITEFKFWEILKNDSSIYSQNYLIKIIKSKILDLNWLTDLKKDSKIKRLFLNIFQQFTINEENINNINQIEYACLENLLFLIDKSCDVIGNTPYYDIITKCFELLYLIYSNKTEKIYCEGVINSIFTFLNNNLTEEVNNIIMNNKNDNIHKITTECLLYSKIDITNKIKIFQFFTENNFKMETYISILNYMLDTNLLDEIEKNKNLFDDAFFNSLTMLLKKIKLTPETLKKNKRDMLFNLNELVDFIIEYVYGGIENGVDNENILYGYLQIIKQLCLDNIEILNKIKSDSNFFSKLFIDCLFETQICNLNKNLRTITYEIILILSIDHDKNTQKIIETLSNYHNLNFWRSNSIYDWNLVPSPEKNKINLTGLINLGMTCYMNSLLQQIFMNIELRENIINNNTIKDNQIFLNLQLLLSQLKFSNMNYITTKNFFDKMTNYEGTSLSNFVQMDVDEFFNLLIDKCNCEDFKNNYEGNISNSYICQECYNNSTSIESFNALDLQIKNKPNLKTSLDNFFDGEILDGDNKYYCSKCQKKVQAEKKTYIQKLPKCLVIVLKRFDFDYEKMIKYKNNDYYEFPFEINMNEYTENKEKDYIYNLKGFIVHKGTADCGHYYSIIKNNDKWFEFNDINIKEFDIKNLERDGFGYSEDMTENKSAYLLFYYLNDGNEYIEKINSIDDIKDKSIVKEINDENHKNTVNRIIFTDEYCYFVQNFIIHHNSNYLTEIFNKHFITKNNNIERYPLKREVDDIINSNIDNLLPKIINIENNFKKPFDDLFVISKFYIKYFLTIGMRLKNKEYIPQMMDISKALLNSSLGACKWIINNFSNIKVLEEFLIKNPLYDMKILILGILYSALINLNKEEKNKKIIHNFINIIIHIIKRKFDDYKFNEISPIYMVLVKFVSFGDESYKYLESVDIINIIRQFFYTKHNQDSTNQLNSFKIDYKEFIEENEFNVINNYNTINNNTIENSSNLIILLCKFIIWNNSYISIFKDDTSFSSSIILESNDRLCVAHLKHIFKKFINDEDILKVVNESLIPLLLNVIQISEDSELYYLIYFFDYLCTLIPINDNNNNDLFITLKKYFNIIELNSQYYLYTYFNIKNLVYIFKNYFNNNPDLISKCEDDIKKCIQWLIDNPFPPSYYPSTTTQLYRNKKVDYNKIKVNGLQYQMFIIEYKKKSNQVKDNLIKILEGKFDEVIEDPEQIIWTNEKDYTNFKFSVGDFIKANAQDGNVIKVLDEMLFLYYKDNNGKIIKSGWLYTWSSIDLLKLHLKNDNV